MARRTTLLLLVVLAAAGLAAVVQGKPAPDLDSLRGAGQQDPFQPAGQWQPAPAAAAEGQEKPTDALASVQPTNLNPLLGSLLLPQWIDDKQPDLWFGQGQLFLKNQDAARALCGVTYTVKIDLAKDQMMAFKNLTLLGTYGTDLHVDMWWLRGKLPPWLPRLGPQQQLNVAYTISAPASALPSFGQFFVEAASFCDDAAAGGGGGGKEAVSAVVVGDGGKRRRRRERRALRRAKESKKGEKQPPAAPAAAEAVQSWAAVDDLFVQNTVDGRWSVQSQTRLNNTDAAKGRCNVQFTVGLEGLGAAGGQDVRVEEGYLVNVTVNAAQARLEGRLVPSFNRIPPGRYVNVGFVLSAPTKEALALSTCTVTAADVC